MTKKVLKINDKQMNSDLKSSGKRESFDRFGDDLCELVLSYLSISDKIRFECLCRQWHQLVYSKQRYLRLSNVRTVDTIEGLLVLNKTRYQSIDLNAFEGVLKKLKYLNTLRIEGRINIDSKLIELIAKHCPHLKHLLITVRYISDITTDCLQLFGRNCGQNLLSIKFDGLTDKQMKQLLKFTPNLRSITVESVRTVLSDKKATKGEELSQLLPKLQEIQFCRCNAKVLTQLQTQYSKSLTKIRTHLLTLDLKSEDMNRALSGFGQFAALESLDLMIDVCNESDVQSIDSGLKQLAANCRHLQKMCFTLDGNLLQTNLFETFGRFKTLSSLEIFIISDQELGDYSYNYGRVDALKQLKDLKHLSLHLEQLSDENLDNIDKYLPKLVSIRLNTSKAITDRTLNCISNMKSLAKLEITCFTGEEIENMTDSGVKQVIQNCPQIQSLTFDQKNSKIDFEMKSSIETLIEKAKQNHKIQFNFSFALNTKTFENINELPNNLLIEIL